MACCHACKVYPTSEQFLGGLPHLLMCLHFWSPCESNEAWSSGGRCAEIPPCLCPLWSSACIGQNCCDSYITASFSKQCQCFTKYVGHSVPVLCPLPNLFRRMPLPATRLKSKQLQVTLLILECSARYQRYLAILLLYYRIASSCHDKHAASFYSNAIKIASIFISLPALFAESNFQ